MPTINPPRPLTPGIYAGVIDDVALVPLAWRASGRNPDGLTVRFGVLIKAADGPAHVFDTIDVDHADRLAAVYVSCGEGVATSPAEAAHSLIGRDCRLVTKNITPRCGKNAGVPKAVVSSWLSPLARDRSV